MTADTENSIYLISKTIYAFYDPSDPCLEFLKKRITHISREIFKSFAYALTCWYWIPLCEYTFSLSIAPEIAWAAFMVHLAFYFRFIIVMLFTCGLAYETYQTIKDPTQNITYHSNATDDDHPLLHHFWFDCGCDPLLFTEEERDQMRALIQEKGFSTPAWNLKPYYDARRRPKKFKRQAFNDFQTFIRKHHIIDLYNENKALTRDDLLDLLETLQTGTKILFYKTASRAESPLFDLAEKVRTFYKNIELDDHKSVCLGLKNFIQDNNWSEDPSLLDNPFFLYTIRKYAPFLQHLKKHSVKCSLLDEALKLSDVPPPSMPQGVSLCLHFKTKKGERMWETTLKTAALEEKWYWHADMVFWEDTIKTDKFNRIGLVSTGYLSDHKLRPAHWNTAEFYRISLPPGIDPTLKNKAEEIFITRMSEMAKTKSKWKTLELRNTFVLKRDQADFSYFPFLELYLLASITFYHKTIRRHWNPETFDVSIPRKLWCSEFNFFLIIDALQQVNQFLENEGHAKLPYPVDGYENTAGITPLRLKDLLMNHKMLAQQFTDKASYKLGI